MKLPLNLMSNGYKSTISLVADIAYRMATLNPQLLDHVCTETLGIILIDEVDLLLHQEWQQRILGDLVKIFPKVLLRGLSIYEKGDLSLHEYNIIRSGLNILMIA